MLLSNVNTTRVSRGYRAVVDVEAGTPAGPQTVRVLDANGRSIDDLLDAESDRRTAPGGRLSLGPLAPGTYAIELRGDSEIRRQPIRIVDRDVQVTMR